MPNLIGIMSARSLATALILLAALEDAVAAAPGETCTAATPELAVLPYQTSGTTVGKVDDYFHGESENPPQCDATGSTCIADDTVYPGTGWGPDWVYAIRTSADCSLEISLDPTDDLPNDDDLALFVFQSSCSDNLSDCLCVSDVGLFGETETVLLSAKAGVTYYLVADGFSPDQDVTSGPYDLSITTSPSGACQLCPAGGCGTGSLLFEDDFDDGDACTWSAYPVETCLPG